MEKHRACWYGQAFLPGLQRMKLKPSDRYEKETPNAQSNWYWPMKLVTLTARIKYGEGGDGHAEYHHNKSAI